jgi:hypothetical protein
VHIRNKTRGARRVLCTKARITIIPQQNRELGRVVCSSACLSPLRA